MKKSANYIKELRIKSRYRAFSLYVACLELDYAIYNTTKAINEFGKVASEALKHD